MTLRSLIQNAFSLLLGLFPTGVQSISESILDGLIDTFLTNTQGIDTTLLMYIIMLCFYLAQTILSFTCLVLIIIINQKDIMKAVNWAKTRLKKEPQKQQQKQKKTKQKKSKQN